MADDDANDVDPQDPRLLSGLDLDAARMEEVARAFMEIRLHIERLRDLDLEETHPAVVFTPLVTRKEP